eukprot:756352-Hanusia_phi.AAC.3
MVAYGLTQPGSAEEFQFLATQGCFPFSWRRQAADLQPQGDASKSRICLGGMGTCSCMGLVCWEIRVPRWLVQKGESFSNASTHLLCVDFVPDSNSSQLILHFPARACKYSIDEFSSDGDSLSTAGAHHAPYNKSHNTQRHLKPNEILTERIIDMRFYADRIRLGGKAIQHIV